jgi:rubrerythrin
MSNYADDLMQAEVRDMVKYEDLAKQAKGTPAEKAFKQMAADEGSHRDVIKWLKDSGHMPNPNKSELKVKRAEILLKRAIKLETGKNAFKHWREAMREFDKLSISEKRELKGKSPKLWKICFEPD